LAAIGSSFSLSIAYAIDLPNRTITHCGVSFEMANVEHAVIEQREFELPASADIGLRKEQLGRSLPPGASLPILRQCSPRQSFLLQKRTK
jgi:hypothetical protein